MNSVAGLLLMAEHCRFFLHWSAFFRYFRFSVNFYLHKLITAPLKKIVMAAIEEWTSSTTEFSHFVASRSSICLDYFSMFFLYLDRFYLRPPANIVIGSGINEDTFADLMLVAEFRTMCYPSHHCPRLFHSSPGSNF